MKLETMNKKVQELEYALGLYSWIGETIGEKEFRRTGQEANRQRSKYKGRTQYRKK